MKILLPSFVQQIIYLFPLLIKYYAGHRIRTHTCRNSHITETKPRSFCIKMNFSPAADRDLSRAVMFINEADKFSSVFASDKTVLLWDSWDKNLELNEYKCKYYSCTITNYESDFKHLYMFTLGKMNRINSHE